MPDAMGVNEKSKTQTTQVLWLRNDLRLHDHEGFRLAIQNGSPLAVVFILPQHWLEEDAYGMTRLGSAKAHFLRASLIDLHRQLEDQTIDLHMYLGDPVDILTRLRDEICGNMRLITSVAQAPEEAAWLSTLAEYDMEIETYESQTLFTEQQMEALLQDFPASFSKFRKTVESNADNWCVPESTPPSRLSIHEHALRTEAHISWPSSDYAVRLEFQGGERAGLHWLEDYLWQEKAIAHYKDTRNQLRGRYSSSHLSLWLAWGCLSPRFVWHEILKYEASYGSNEQTYWLRFELLWREYFHWSLRVHGRKLFYPGGLQGNRATHSFSEPHWQAWCHANTGLPMVDAGLRELRHTGFVSNRLRQNMASYFIHQLKLDWRLGARWFEMYLADFDVASNYGNWAYIAGCGHDPRPVREFNLNKQLQQYDPELKHIKCWCPEVDNFSLQEILDHQSNRTLIQSFPKPMVTVPAYDMKYD